MPTSEWPTVSYLPEQNAQLAMQALRQQAELLLLALLLGFLSLVFWLNWTEIFQDTIIASGIALAIILSVFAFRIARLNPLVVWTPLFWFRLSCAAYYGFGSVVPYLVSEEGQRRISAIYNYSDTTALKVSIVYVAGILMTLWFSYILLTAKWLSYIKPAQEPRRQNSSLVFALAFLFIGIAIRYGINLPYTFGLLGDVVIPGSLLMAGNFFYVGLYLLVRSHTRSSGMALLVGVLILVDALVSLASFAKTELLMLMIFTLLGWLSQKVSAGRVAIGGGLVLAAFIAFQPLVEYGREAVYASYGSIQGASLGERLEIVDQYLKGASGAGGDANADSALLRMSYVNVSAYVVDQFDSGTPGTTLQNALASFVPRALWPDKPVISELGENLYSELTGKTGTSFGVGHFGEAYWNNGWIGLPLFLIPLAIIFVIMSRFSLEVMAFERWIYMPVVLLGVLLGVRSDGHFVVDIIGRTWIAVCLGAGIWLLRRVFAPRPQMA